MEVMTTSTHLTNNTEMANDKNKKEEEQNAIESLDTNLRSASEKIAENKKTIFWVLGGVAVVAAFVIGYLFIYKNPKTNKAFEDYNQVEISAMGNDSLAAVQYKKVADANKGNDAGKLAALSAAESFYNQKKYKEAIEYLDRFSSGDPVLEANAIILKGDCYVNLKKYDEAISCYGKAISKADKNPQIVPRVLLKEANIYDVQKKYQMALDCYQQIADEYPQFQPGSGVGIDAYIAREKARLGK